MSVRHALSRAEPRRIDLPLRMGIGIAISEPSRIHGYIDLYRQMNKVSLRWPVQAVRSFCDRFEYCYEGSVTGGL